MILYLKIYLNQNYIFVSLFYVVYTVDLQQFTLSRLALCVGYGFGVCYFHFELEEKAISFTGQ